MHFNEKLKIMWSMLETDEKIETESEDLEP